MRKFQVVACIVIAATLLGVAGAQPVIVPDRPLIRLDEVGLYSVGYVLRGKPEKHLPLGWSGGFDDRIGLACEPRGTQNGRQTFLLHCPWRNGTGITFQQFTFALPASATSVRLRGATAMGSENTAQSDGVTFRVFVNGSKRLDYHQTNDAWRPFEFDLTKLRGSNSTIRFEVDPGPKNNPAFDFSLWGDRELVIEGISAKPSRRPPPPPLVLSNLWSGHTLEVAPPSGFPGRSTITLSNDVVWFSYAGPDGSLEYEWRAPHELNEGIFGQLILHAQMKGDQPVSVPLANSAEISWKDSASAISNRWVSTNHTYALARTYHFASGTATISIAGELLGKTLALTVTCDRPQVAAFDMGSWGPVMRRRKVPIPYYTGEVFHLQQEELFVSSILDWTVSGASSHSGSRADYRALTDGTRNLLQERALFTAAWHLPEVLPNPPNPASPWRSFLANKIILDVWGGSFTNIARNLETLADYGITNCVAIIHNWQRSGYDNALPMHYPANPKFGGDPGMRHLVAAARALGIRCALHENYVDYYPNYDLYDTNEIALDSAGKKQLGWYQPETRIQSFAVKPNAILPLAGTQSSEIHRLYGTEANYLDVHSAVPPWFHVDQRAGEEGAGRLTRVWEVHRGLWDYERQTHGGPVLGEGNAHWYWSGALDGVEAQFGSGWHGGGGFDAPLAVDFDLLKIHPLQFNHGMGYYSRWWPGELYSTNWAGGPVPMVVLDRYRLQEVAYGHAGFLDHAVYAHVHFAWLEHHLLSPVMARYAMARPVDIRYENGGKWQDATATAKLDDPKIWSMVRVQYENGLTVTANGSSNTMKVGKWALPSLGWVAEGAGVAAGTTLRQGVIADFADSVDTLFVNARPALDWNLSKFRRVQPKVASFEPTGARSFRVSYEWTVQDRLLKDTHCFVHFSQGGEIRAQQDHSLREPTSKWPANGIVSDGPWEVTLPANLADGDYDWLIGLFDAKQGSERVPLQGVDDGTRRIRLGVLRLKSSGSEMTFAAETNAPATDLASLYAQHLNTANPVVDFGDIRTDGSVLLRRNGSGWTLMPWPRTRNFTVELNAERFGRPSGIHCSGRTNAAITPVQAGSRWRLRLNGAAEYRW